MNWETVLKSAMHVVNRCKERSRDVGCLDMLREGVVSAEQPDKHVTTSWMKQHHPAATPLAPFDNHNSFQLLPTHQLLSFKALTLLQHGPRRQAKSKRYDH